MVYPVIMAGGAGQRFWPMSTPQMPKQFLALLDSKKSMMRLTIDRLLKIAKREDIWIVSHQGFLPLLRKNAAGTKRAHWLLEPMMRNTAPCIGWAALRLYRKDPAAVMVVVPADQWIKQDRAFGRDIISAVEFVKKHPKSLVTFGIRPDYPETGYGYMEAPGASSQKICPVKRFVEKPNLETATRLVKQRNYYWNSGMFVWRADAILNEIKIHLPALYAGLERMNRGNLSQVYKRFPKVSIDTGVMERSRHVFVLKASFDWTDLGSWKSVFLHRKKRSKKWVSLDSKNCFVDARHRPVATIGVSDLIIVDHPNGLLVCHREDAQRVKDISKYLV